ncbi:hypothetical protein SAPIO_CDS8171 [Scedosporium apiospermum]|uniref:Chromo domain-containing protein n=1 Tax=Pseudallescheria apiosperma TaxID=563466 RepID=A0A084FZ17_PSEDA|nr:uncharacterized protein SAPIO_CDS8171 [Scedosporium apiospermum]KEZ40329.1 hypothetical protein SAPIO_CDS8171 [Scedosporium apiospermum]
MPPAFPVPMPRKATYRGRRRATTAASSRPSRTKKNTTALTKSSVAISDEESSDNGPLTLPVHDKPERSRSRKSTTIDDEEDELPPRRAATATKGKVADENEDEEDEEEGEDEDMEEDDIFVVEKILGHMMNKEGDLLFKVKWEGYEKKSDQTWEPEESLKEGAAELLEEYLASFGGRERIIEESNEAIKTKKRGRKAASTPTESNKRSKRNGHPLDTTPPATAIKAGAWQPPAGSWEDHIETIDACEDEATGKLVVFLNWKNGKKTKHNTDVVYKRCPQKMLRFYENHVRIVKHETAEGVDVAAMDAAVKEAEP